MNKKLRNNVIATAAMVVLSFGIIAGIKYKNGDFGSKVKSQAIDVTAYSNENAQITEAAAILGAVDTVTGYEVTVASAGFNAASPIQMKVTFDADKTTITAFEVLAQEETTGLGANVATEEFQGQFMNMQAPVYTADMAATGTAFDQVTGATLSSKAVANAINAACEFLASVQ